MLRFCKSCEVILGTGEGEICLPCITETATKETAVTPNDIPAGCTGDDTCKWCNPEPLTLEGDIRYLKAHIETKDRQLSTTKFRANIYREAWQDAEKVVTDLRIDNLRLKEEIELLKAHKARYQEEILQLEQEAETYRVALNKVRVIAEEVGLE